MSSIKYAQYGLLWCALFLLSYQCDASAYGQRVMLAVVLDVDKDKEFKADFIAQSMAVYAINYAYSSDNGKQVIGVFASSMATFVAQKKIFLRTLRLLDVRRVSLYEYDPYIDMFTLFKQKQLTPEAGLSPMHVYCPRDYFKQR